MLSNNDAAQFICKVLSFNKNMKGEAEKYKTPVTAWAHYYTNFRHDWFMPIIY